MLSHCLHIALAYSYHHSTCPMPHVLSSSTILNCNCNRFDSIKGREVREALALWAVLLLFFFFDWHNKKALFILARPDHLEGKGIMICKYHHIRYMDALFNALEHPMLWLGACFLFVDLSCWSSDSLRFILRMKKPIFLLIESRSILFFVFMNAGRRYVQRVSPLSPPPFNATNKKKETYDIAPLRSFIVVY